MNEFELGTMLLWAASWAPDDFVFCEGQVLSIAGYQELFSLIGDKYGGDGQRTFALPDLRGNAPIGAGSYDGGYVYNLGAKSGASKSQVVLKKKNLMSHNHELSDALFSMPESNVTMSVEVSTDLGERTMPSDNDYIGSTTKVSGKSVKLYRKDAVNAVKLSGLSGTVPAQTVSMDGYLAKTGEGKPFQVPTMQPYLPINYIICINGLYPSRYGYERPEMVGERQVARDVKRPNRRRKRRHNRV